MLLRRLKYETQDCHQRLETRLSERLNSLDIAGYRKLLGRLHGFYSPVEQAVADMMPPFYQAFLAPRRKVGLLRDDLLYLNSTPRDLEGLPRCRKLPLLGGPVDAWGCLYVFEGATLGGQLICRLLNQRLLLGPAGGLRFFASYGERVGLMWNEFRAALESAVDLPDYDRAVGAARDTFEAMEDWLISE